MYTMGPNDVRSPAVSHLPLGQWWTLTPEDKEAWLMDIVHLHHHGTHATVKSRFKFSFLILEQSEKAVKRM